MKKLVLALLVLCPIAANAKCTAKWIPETLVFLSTSDDGVTMTFTDPGSPNDADGCVANPKDCRILPCGAPGSACLDAPVGYCLNVLVNTCTFSGLTYASAQGFEVIDTNPCPAQ